FVEAATDGFLRHLEVVPGFGSSGVQLGECLLHKMQGSGRRIRLEVCARPIALDRVAPFGNLPLELNLRQGSGLWKIDLHALSCGFYVSDVDDARQSRGPKARDRAAPRVKREVILCALVIPARRHHPGVLVLEVALLRPGEGALVPGMPLID